MVWGGQVAGQTEARTPLGLARKPPELAQVTQDLQEMQLDIATNQVERQVMEELQILLRKPDLETPEVDEILHSHLGEFSIEKIVTEEFPDRVPGLSLLLLPLCPHHVRHRHGLQARQGPWPHMEPPQFLPIVHRVKETC